MSIADKQLFIKNVERRLSKSLTADSLSIVSDALLDELYGFELEQSKEQIQNGGTNDCLTAFLETKAIEGRSPKTIEHYRYILNRFYEIIGLSTPDITVYHLRSYLAKGKEKGYQDKTLEGIRSVFCSYFGWLHKEGLIKQNPCVNLSPIKCQKKIRLPYSDVDVEKLKECCVSLRDRAFISFLQSTGCRISEVCQLNRTDICYEKLEVTVLGKGNKERTVYFDEVTAMLLKRYLSERNDDYPALFIGKGTERLHPGGVRKRLHDLSKAAGVENVHPHRFRRTLATNLIQHGMPIQEVATILGHDKLDTTLKYVYLDKNDVKNSYRKYF